jgi:hypothetical protein
MLVVVCLTGCAFNPVTATDCVTQVGPHQTVTLHATIVSHTWKRMTHVGVLVMAAGINGTGGSLIEYEFHDRIDPFETRRNVVGEEYAAVVGHNSVGAHLGAISSCWARFVDYADGSGWSTSPL